MQRFLVFAGKYYPGGGWHDFAGAFETRADAERAIQAGISTSDWVQLVDLQTHRIVATWEQGRGPLEEPSIPNPVD